MSTPEQDRLLAEIYADLMDLDDNPQGLATSDPMTDPQYRAVARRIADNYLREHGLPPWTWPEDAGGRRQAIRVEDLTEDDLARIRAAQVEPQDNQE